MAAVVAELPPELQGQVETQQYEHDRNGNVVSFVNAAQIEDTSAAADATGLQSDSQPKEPVVEEVLEGQSHEDSAVKNAMAEVEEVKDSQIVPSTTGEVPAPVEIAPFQEEKSESEDEIEETVSQCKQCGVSCQVLDMVERNPNQLWCKGCHCITTTLRRHLAWPPQGFTSLTLQEQQGFWQDAAKTKQEGDPCFRYDRIRDVLRQRLVTRKINQSKREVGGKYRPLDVLKRKGYPIPPNFEATAPREWNESLQTWCYLLAEVSVNESQVNESIEETLLEAERLVKKKKLQVSTESQDALASSGAHIVMDLITDDEEEEAPKTGQVFFPCLQNLFLKFSPLVSHL